MSLSAVFAAKATLRKKLKLRLSQIPPEERIRQSRIVTEKVLNSQVYQKSQRISIYLSLEEEVSTKSLLEAILSSKKQCYIPRYDKNGMEMLRLYSMEDYNALPLTKWNIPQPKDGDTGRDNALASGGLDLILLPGLGFTIDGARIGRGKGFYDKFLEKCSNSERKPTTIGLAFKEQILPSIPTTETDMKLNMVFYPE